MHAALRDAGPLVHLTQYDLYAMARYEEVHAALVNWQEFQSAAGVGLSNFTKEKPWRPPSILLEADPPKHDAPRRVLQKVLSPRSLRKLRDGWLADADALVDEVLSETQRVRRQAAPGGRVPAAGVPGRRRHRAGRPGEPAALRGPRVQRVRAAERPGRQGRAPRGRAVGLGRRPVPAGRARAGGVRRGHLGGLRPRRHHPRAGAARRPVAADGRRRHDGARHLRRPLRLRHQPRPVAAAAREPVAGAGRVRRGGALGVAGADVLPHGDDRRPRGRARRARGAQDPHVPGVGEPRPAALGRTRTRSTSPATRPGTSASAWASTSASASTSPGWRPRR